MATFVTEIPEAWFKNAKYRVVRVVPTNNQIDLFEDAWYNFVYADEVGNEVQHPTPFSSEEKAAEGGRKYVEFLNG